MQEPDKDGRIIVSKKISAEEWKRTITICAGLPIKMDEYVETAIKAKNDHHESNSPEIETNSWNKMKIVCEDLEKTLVHVGDLKVELERKDQLIDRLVDEAQKKAAEKVHPDMQAIRDEVNK